MRPQIKTVVEQAHDDPGLWYWALKIDGETYADGEADSRVLAQYRVGAALEEWKQKNA